MKKAKQNIDTVLFLSGVFKKDCSKIDLQLRKTNEYDSIPLTFTSLESHPRQTNLLCWNCTRNFKGYPWFEPQSMSCNSRQLRKNEPRKDIHFSCHGNFCSAPCVRKYIDTHTRSLSERNDKISMLKIEYEIFMGKPIDFIPPAPSHTNLVQFGGTMTLDAYVLALAELDSNYKQTMAQNSISITDTETERFFID